MASFFYAMNSYLMCLNGLYHFHLDKRDCPKSEFQIYKVMSEELKHLMFKSGDVLSKQDQHNYNIELYLNSLLAIEFKLL